MLKIKFEVTQRKMFKIKFEVTHRKMFKIKFEVRHRKMFKIKFEVRHRKMFKIKFEVTHRTMLKIKFEHLHITYLKFVPYSCEYCMTTRCGGEGTQISSQNAEQQRNFSADISTSNFGEIRQEAQEIKTGLTIILSFKHHM